MAAPTLSIQALLQISSGNNVSKIGSSLSITPSGSNTFAGVQAITTAAEALAVGDCATLRYASFVNPSDSGATVTITLASMVLKPGDAAVFPPASTAVTFQATGAMGVFASGAEA